ncbi:hypothetical protein [Natrinema sp. DC36]|uniref:hypothetical protein n=1 Tax=Natrinema sp. DC36 TaxID=2878680 RepID=UPI001CF0548B|nr:hypothetical protein [Natrinema sp. DC36]
MKSVLITVHYLALGLGVIGGIVGITVHGIESGILWALVGYFFGKAIQSIFWTIGGGD